MQKKITQGAIFITRKGNPLDRSNIWSEMKSLCEEARVGKSKVFPHNLRHLFVPSQMRFKQNVKKILKRSKYLLTSTHFCDKILGDVI